MTKRKTRGKRRKRTGSYVPFWKCGTKSNIYSGYIEESNKASKK